MANYTDETTVRTKTQLTDTAKVSSTLVTQSIDDAHDEILKRIDPAFDVSPPDDNLKRGETLLAGAFLLRSLSSGEAFDIKDLRLKGQGLGETRKWKALGELADQFEKKAWEILGPFLLERTGGETFQSGVTDSMEVLGEE